MSGFLGFGGGGVWPADSCRGFFLMCAFAFSTGLSSAPLAVAAAATREKEGVLVVLFLLFLDFLIFSVFATAAAERSPPIVDSFFFSFVVVVVIFVVFVFDLAFDDDMPVTVTMGILSFFSFFFTLTPSFSLTFFPPAAEDDSGGFFDDFDFDPRPPPPPPPPPPPSFSRPPFPRPIHSTRCSFSFTHSTSPSSYLTSCLRVRLSKAVTAPG